jgi:hypothetical protein
MFGVIANKISIPIANFKCTVDDNQSQHMSINDVGLSLARSEFQVYFLNVTNISFSKYSKYILPLSLVGAVELYSV